MEYVDRTEYPLIQVARTHQHNTDSAGLHTARCLKTEVLRETRKMKDTIEEKTKGRWHRERMHGQLPRNLDEKLVEIEVISLFKIWRHQARNRKYNSGSSRPSN